MVGPLTSLYSYLLGSIPFGYLMVRWQKGIDVRQTGSGSIGATNVIRNLGVGGFVTTLLLDVGKGAAAIWLTSRLTSDDPRWLAASSVAVVLGHCFPVWLKFRGGKGVATGLGVFLLLSPLAIGMVSMIFASVVILWRYISLGSILAVAAFPLAVYFLKHPPLPILLGAAVNAVIIIGKHHTNIRRLLKGTENRFGSRSGQSAPAGLERPGKG